MSSWTYGLKGPGADVNFHLKTHFIRGNYLVKLLFFLLKDDNIIHR